MLQQACRTFADWQRRFPDGGLDYITVNVSSRQLMQQNFLRIVEQAVQQAGLKPCDLRLEITETALMDSPNEAAELLRELREFGVKIYLDDFGTGYSSLSHLHKLPVDALKIDRSFVKSLLLPDRPAIVESILALARTLNTSVVAEGIEERRAGARAGAPRVHARPGLPLLASAVDRSASRSCSSANQPLGPKRPQRTGLERRRRRVLRVHSVSSGASSSYRTANGTPEHAQSRNRVELSTPAAAFSPKIAANAARFSVRDVGRPAAASSSSVSPARSASGG